MARRTIVIHTDDLGGKGTATPTTLSLNGKKVTVDLNKRNIGDLERKLAKYFEAGQGNAPADNAEVRKWAEQNGITLGARGRIPAAVRDAFNASR